LYRTLEIGQSVQLVAERVQFPQLSSQSKHLRPS
jgi:hypothetical protein